MKGLADSCLSHLDLVSGTFPQFPYNFRGGVGFALASNSHAKKCSPIMPYSTTPFVKTRGVLSVRSRIPAHARRISGRSLVCVLLLLLTGRPGLAGQIS